MNDWYQIPALILTTLLLPAFGQLYVRSRDTRTLLWFLAFLCAVVRMFLLYPLGAWDFSQGTHPWLTATGQACAFLSSALLLGSLSPGSFRVGKFRILYVIPFFGPMLIYAFAAEGVFHNVPPRGPAFLLFPAICVIAIITGLFWSMVDRDIRRPVGITSCLVFGGLALWACFGPQLDRPLLIAETGNHVVTALLILMVFRRLSPGVVLSFIGLMGWACPAALLLPLVASNPDLGLIVVRLIIMAKVVTAMGLILLALENELAANKATGERERRARQELEAYTKLALTRRRVEDFDRQADGICQTVVDYSRFSQATLLLLHSSGSYRLEGSAGIDIATRKALEALATRIPVEGFLDPVLAEPAVPNSEVVWLNLEPWLTPGDDLAHLRFTSALAVPMRGREATEGALLLSGMRHNVPSDPLRIEDVLPLEMLAARIQAVRNQTTMLEKLIDSEKFAGLGQLAGNVTQQLNNPLTVILGYASLLEDAPHLDDHQRKGIEAILSEARRMRSTLQSLSRVARAPGGQRTAISVAELLADMEHLHRAEFLQRSIAFRLKVAPSIPRVRCHAQQLRQAVLHCLHFAIEAVENLDSASDRSVRLEAAAEGNRVQILVAHSGPGFNHPERAFDPFHSIQPGGPENSALGLSLCATILRDNDGTASAVNLEPQGAAILLEFQAA